MLVKILLANNISDDYGDLQLSWKVLLASGAFLISISYKLCHFLQINYYLTLYTEIR